MARQPTGDYDVDVVRVSPHHYAPLVRTGTTTGAPGTFSTTCYVDEGRLAVIGVITVIPGGQAVMVEMTVHGGPATATTTAPVTTSSLRRILVDQIVRAAVTEATVDMPPDDVGDPSTLGERMESASQARAAEAAKHYLAAQASGSSAPTLAVAAEMDVSRSQASRYVRAARDAGLLPPTSPGAPQG